jgi:uncharacterized coiled-coil protein SlyX
MDSRDDLINELQFLVAKQAAQLEKQAAQVERQTARIAELELKLAKALKDSSTSSKPPSSDPRETKAEKETWPTEETASWRSAWTLATSTSTAPRKSRQ